MTIPIYFMSCLDFAKHVPTTANPAGIQITDDINKRLGDWIKKHPEDWFWLHNRWKWTDRFYPELKEES